MASEDPSSNASFLPLRCLKFNPRRNRTKLGLCSLGVLEAHFSGHLSPGGLRAPVPQARCKIELSVQVEAGSREVDWSSSHPGVPSVLLRTIMSAIWRYFGASSLSCGEIEAQGELRPALAWWGGFILTPQGSLMPNPELVLCSMCVWRTVCVCARPGWGGGCKPEWRDLPKVSQAWGEGLWHVCPQKATCRRFFWRKEELRVRSLSSCLPSLAPALLLTGCSSAYPQT